MRMRREVLNHETTVSNIEQYIEAINKLDLGIDCIFFEGKLMIGYRLQILRE